MTVACTLQVMSDDKLLERETTHHVIGAFFEVYNTLGFGFLEQVYREALERELIERSRIVQKEVLISVRYKGSVLSTQRVDLIVDNNVIVEIKSTETCLLQQGASFSTISGQRRSRLAFYCISGPRRGSLDWFTPTSPTPR